jgi:predicted phage tail protein
MTKINLHGILGVLYGKEFKIHVQSGFFALKALNCIKNGFLKKLKSLHEQNLTYSIIIDGEWVCDKDNLHSFKKIKQIDIVPAISGAGLGSWLMVGLTFFLVAAAVFTGGATLMAALAMGALAAGAMALQMLLAPKEKSQAANQQYVGGQSSSSSAQNRSYAFSNQENLSVQNVPVPLGYGRMRIGTKIIQTSTKAFPTNASVAEQFKPIDLLLDKTSLGFIS